MRRSQAVLVPVTVMVLLSACGDDSTAPPSPDPSSRRLEFGESVEGHLESISEIDTLTFAGQTGQVAVVVLQAHGDPVRARVWVRGLPTQNIVWASADWGRPGGWSQTFAIQSSGDHQILLDPLAWANLPPDRALGRGSYTISLREANAAPERHAEALSLGEVVVNEALDPPGDLDVFSFSADSGTELNVFLKAPDTTASIRLLLLDPQSERPLGELITRGEWQSLPAGPSTGRRALPATATYRISVEADPFNFGVPAAAVIPFRLELYPIDRAPENKPDRIEPEVEVRGERIDRPGDVDEFRFAAQAGEVYDLFFQAIVDVLEDELAALIIAPDKSTIANSGSVNSSYTGVLPPRTGFFEIEESGEHRLVVLGRGNPLHDSLAYTALLHRVSVQPEHVPATLVPGDSVAGERIDPPTDRDVFSLPVSDSMLVWALFSTSSTGGGGELTYTLHLDDTTDLFGGFADERIGPLFLGPNAYSLEVQGWVWDPARFSGVYRILTSRSGLGPEDVPAALAVGDTVTESVTPLGDIDVFTVGVAARQHLDASLQGLGQLGGEDLALWFGPSGAPPVATTTSESQSGSLDNARTGRITPELAGIYELRVVAGRMGPGWDARGSYRVAVVPLDPRPETVADEVAVGDSIVGEALDSAGDVDRFSVIGTPGQQVVLGLLTAPGTRAFVETFDAATGATEQSVGSSAELWLTAPTPVGGNRRLPFEVLETCTVFCNYQQTGSYKAYAWPFDPAPESALSNILLGETVTDAIDPPGDVDEFSFSAAAGRRVAVYLAHPGAEPPTAWFSLDLVAPDGTLLSNPSSSIGLAAGTGLTKYADYDLPQTGSYTLRVRWAPNHPADTTPYRLLVQ